MLPLKGVVHVCGEHDTGKTTFALECGAAPERICFFDSDVKGRATVQELQERGIMFGAYHDLTALGEELSQVQLHEHCMRLIKSIQPGSFDAILWDTWTRFAGTFRHVVFANPNRFRKAGEWSNRGDFKGGEMNKEAQEYEARVINHLQGLVPTVILVTHLKDFYYNNAKTDKLVPAATRTLNRIPRFRIWLRHNEKSPVPIGLVLKRLDEKIVTPDGLRTVCVLPRRVVPKDGHASLWDTIRWYYENPVGSRPPTSDETPDEFELSILDGTLTRDQRRTLELALGAGAVSSREEDEEALADLNGDLDAVRSALEKLGDDATPAALAQETGLAVPVVLNALRTLRG